MKSIQQIVKCGSLVLLLLVFTSCGSQPPQKVEETPLNTPEKAAPATTKVHPVDSTTLPVEYQKPIYTIGKERTKEDKELAQSDVVMKVGASIHSTTGPQPLREIIKRLAALKGMSISWASDVDQGALVDVDINANDDFNLAIDHLLRQVKYFHEIKGNTIIIKHKETRVFHIAMPFISQTYKTDTGGDVLGSEEQKSQFKGQIRVTATGSPIGTSVFDSRNGGDKKTQFDVWANIETNLKVILDILETSEASVSTREREFGGSSQASGQYAGQGTYQEGASGSSGSVNASGSGQRSAQGKSSGKGEYQLVKTARQTSKSGDYFIIDKPVGIITVTATRDLLDKVDKYLTTLQKELYKQVNIEAKIIEVELTHNSDMGINWSKVLKNFQLTGLVDFGNSGQVWPNPNADTFISKISLSSTNFYTFLNALKEEGKTKILSNPKISVMNGEPAFITVGQNKTYIDKIDVTKDNATSGSLSTTYTATTSRVLSGVGLALTANVMGNNEIVMNLVPVTSQLKPAANGDEIEYKTIGEGEVGLPVINVREMSTTVRVKSGEMLVIGGLINSQKTDDGQFAPVLGDIPIIKYLFGYQSNQHKKSELIILLRPTII